MPYRITRYHETPNPNAVKCTVSPDFGSGIRSFRTPESGHDKASALAPLCTVRIRRETKAADGCHLLLVARKGWRDNGPFFSPYP